MSDKMRWRYGDTNPVVAAVDAAQIIEIGDLLYQVTDDARAASTQGDQGTEAANQRLFAKRFLGVAMQMHRSGDTVGIRVATTGIFEFSCPSTAFELGDLIGVCGYEADFDVYSLRNQEVAKVDASRLAIGRVAKREPSPTTSVLVDIRSTIMTGGVEGSSCSIG